MLQKGSSTVGFSKELCGMLRVKTEGMFVVAHLKSCNAIQATENAHLDILTQTYPHFRGLLPAMMNCQLGKANKSFTH